MLPHPRQMDGKDTSQHIRRMFHDTAVMHRLPQVDQGQDGDSELVPIRTNLLGRKALHHSQGRDPVGLLLLGLGRDAPVGHDGKVALEFG